MKRKILRILLWSLVAILVLLAIGVARNLDTIQRVFLGGVKVYETTPPALPADLKRPAILVFSKTNGFRHEEAIPAANALFEQFASQNGWGYFQTESGATFSPEILSRFDAVVFNNVSGDVFTPEQRQALKAFIKDGGGFVGVHGSGGDMSYDWRWYVDHLIGAQFIGHPMDPQFQAATVRTESNQHPATKDLPDAWTRTDEWYAFNKSVRDRGYNVLLTLDEDTYTNHEIYGKDLRMGKDHPIAWWHCVGQGRVLYSAMGHRASAYAEPEHRKLLLGAVNWAMKTDGPDCATPSAEAPPPPSPGSK